MVLNEDPRHDSSSAFYDFFVKESEQRRALEEKGVMLEFFLQFWLVQNFKVIIIKTGMPFTTISCRAKMCNQGRGRVKNTRL